MTSIVSKEDLRARTQKYLFICSSNPDYIAFLERNNQTIKDYLIKHSLSDSRAYQNLSEKDMLKLNVDMYVHAFKLSQQMKQPDMIYRKADYVFSLMGITLNTNAFLNTIQLLGNDQQGQKWRQAILNGKAFGGYGQTELGHGSNVQGLELQAHYDEKKQVFKFNSPTITSAKYWPGVLGLVCTHSVVQAKTFVKGKSIGIQTFIFQVRDQNLKQIKGVKAGDIGPKFGFQRVDNGYLLIDNVQVPRDFMLMRYVQVTPEGEVIGRQNKQAVKYAYGSMLYLRVALPFNFAWGHIIAPARQLFALYDKMGIQNEPQYRKQIIKYLCVGEGIIVANMFSQKLFTIFSTELKNKNFEKADKVLVKCHIISATFKALTSWKALRISTELATRNFYTSIRTTGLPFSFNNIVPAVTYEGDNSVLLQQTARFILMKDKGQEIQKPHINIKDNDIPAVINMLKYVSSMQIRRLKKSFQAQFEAGVDMKIIWNQKYQRDIIDVSKLWGVLQLIQGFADTLKDMKEVQGYFEKVGKVFAKNLLSDVPEVFTYGFKIEETESWKQFTDNQFWALTHKEKVVSGNNEQQQLHERKGAWIRSKL